MDGMQLREEDLELAGHRHTMVFGVVSEASLKQRATPEIGFRGEHIEKYDLIPKNNHNRREKYP